LCIRLLNASELLPDTCTVKNPCDVSLPVAHIVVVSAVVLQSYQIAACVIGEPYLHSIGFLRQQQTAFIVVIGRYPVDCLLGTNAAAVVLVGGGRGTVAGALQLSAVLPCQKKRFR